MWYGLVRYVPYALDHSIFCPNFKTSILVFEIDRPIT